MHDLVSISLTDSCQGVHSTSIVFSLLNSSKVFLELKNSDKVKPAIFAGRMLTSFQSSCVNFPFCQQLLSSASPRLLMHYYLSFLHDRDPAGHAVIPRYAA